MDKRRLYQEIADVKKMIFAFTSTGAMVIVFLAALFRYHNPLNLHAIMIWTIGSYVFFALAGMVLANIYERIIEGPLIESYRDEARARIEALKSGEPEKLQMQIPVTDLQTGMKVIHQVNSPEGALLVRPGAVLTKRLIRNLQEAGIDSVTVEAQRSSSVQLMSSSGESEDDLMVDL